MNLICNRCGATFNSMFGPPTARCTKCTSTDTRHADNVGVPVGGPPPMTPMSPPAMPPMMDSFGYPIQQGPSLGSSPDSSAPGVPNTQPWLVASIVLMVTCCQPGGMIALYFLDQAKTLARRGDMVAAQEKFSYAKLTLLLAWPLGLLVVGAIIVVTVLGG